MNALIEKLRNEPVLVTGLVAAAMTLLVSFGVDLSDTQMSAIAGLVVAVMAIIGRQAVTPNSKL